VRAALHQVVAVGGLLVSEMLVERGRGRCSGSGLVSSRCGACDKSLDGYGPLVKRHCKCLNGGRELFAGCSARVRISCCGVRIWSVGSRSLVIDKTFKTSHKYLVGGKVRAVWPGCGSDSELLGN
jgi:hypothetical protein